MNLQTTLEPPSKRPSTLPQPPQAPKSGPRWWLWLIILALAGYGTYRAIQYEQSKPPSVASPKGGPGGGGLGGARPAQVVAAVVQRGDMPVYLRGLGSVSAFNTVTVRSRVDGQLVKVLFKEGQLVKEGELLAEIDPRPYQAQLDQALGQLARDEAQLNDAKVNLERNKALYAEQVIAKQQLDTQAALVGQFDGAIQADQAQIDNAKLQLSYSKIMSPLTGRVGLRLVDQGNIIHATDPNGLVVIAQLQPIAVLFTIPQDDLQPVLKKLNAGAKLRADAFDRDNVTKIATGTLLTVDNTIDQTTGTSKLKAVFDNKDSALFPNQFVNVQLLLDTMRNVVLAPAAAVQRGPQGTFVYQVLQNKVKVTPVTVERTEGSDVVISAGLKGGEQVVVDGGDKLVDGASVEVREAQPRTGRRGQASTAGLGQPESGHQGAVPPGIGQPAIGQPGAGPQGAGQQGGALRSQTQGSPQNGLGQSGPGKHRGPK